MSTVLSHAEEIYTRIITSSAFLGEVDFRDDEETVEMMKTAAEIAVRAARVYAEAMRNIED